MCVGIMLLYPGGAVERYSNVLAYAPKQRYYDKPRVLISEGRDNH